MKSCTHRAIRRSTIDPNRCQWCLMHVFLPIKTAFPLYRSRGKSNDFTRRVVFGDQGRERWNFRIKKTNLNAGMLKFLDGEQHGEYSMNCISDVRKQDDSSEFRFCFLFNYISISIDVDDCLLVHNDSDFSFHSACSRYRSSLRHDDKPYVRLLLPEFQAIINAILNQSIVHLQHPFRPHHPDIGQFARAVEFWESKSDRKNHQSIQSLPHSTKPHKIPAAITNAAHFIAFQIFR